MKTYPSTKQVISDLKKAGFTYDFNEDYKRICCPEGKNNFALDEFRVIQIHRIENPKRLNQGITLLVIQSAKYGIKGYWTHINETSSPGVQEPIVEAVTADN